MLQTEIKTEVEQILSDRNTILCQDGLKAIFKSGQSAYNKICESPFFWNGINPDHPTHAYEFNTDLFWSIQKVLKGIIDTPDTEVTFADISEFSYAKGMLTFYHTDAQVIYNSIHRILSYDNSGDSIAGVNEKVNIKKEIYG